jgi:hypothetical protein
MEEEDLWERCPGPQILKIASMQRGGIPDEDASLPLLTHCGVVPLRSVIQQPVVALFAAGEIYRARDKVPFKTSEHLSEYETFCAKYCFQPFMQPDYFGKRDMPT